MIRRFLAWLTRRSLRRLEREAYKYGSLTLQQTAFENGPGWTVSLRPHQEADDARGPRQRRYSWTSGGETLAEAISNVIAEAKVGKVSGVGYIAQANYAPRLGGKEFDD